MLQHLADRIRFARHCVVHRRSLAYQRRWQLKRVRELLTYAQHHVPLWKKILNDIGMDPAKVRSTEDLRVLPVTSKQTYIGRVVEEYIDSSRAAKAFWYVTSGTSGTPFRFLYSDRAVTDAYNDFGSLRFLWWDGHPLTRIASVRMARIKIRASSKPYRAFIAVERFLQDPVDVLQELHDFDPEILSAYPSILLEMSRVIERNPSVPRPRPRYILSFGEMLYPSLRERISSVLGAEIYDRYGLEEIGSVGVECHQHDGFHINSESVIVEVLDDAGRLLPDGMHGRIVVTDLLNYNMPFIRYDSGDRGSLTSAPCACGLRSPRIWVEGRFSAFLDFPHRRIHHLEFDGAMDGFMHEVLQYQIAKRSDAHVVVRVVPGVSFNEHVAARIRKNLSALVGPTIAIDIEEVGALPVTPRGKSRIVIDESRPSAH